MLGLDPGEATTDWAIGELGRRRRVHIFQAQEAMEIIVAKTVKETGVPAEGGGSDRYRSDGVTDVMIAVAERALPILPGFPPEDG